MPYHHCFVPLCVNDSRYDQSLSFHFFPGDPETRMIWIQKIRRDPGKFLSITTHTQKYVQPISPRMTLQSHRVEKGC